jgi:hypothetical protein
LVFGRFLRVWDFASIVYRNSGQQKKLISQDYVGYSPVVEALNTARIGIFTVFTNKENARRDKQDGGINFFRWPYINQQ